MHSHDNHKGGPILGRLYHPHSIRLEFACLGLPGGLES
jgi:hypothetical protein